MNVILDHGLMALSAQSLFPRFWFLEKGKGLEFKFIKLKINNKYWVNFTNLYRQNKYIQQATRVLKKL